MGVTTHPPARPLRPTWESCAPDDQPVPTVAMNNLVERAVRPYPPIGGPKPSK
jgi:hypothetical protein